MTSEHVGREVQPDIIAIESGYEVTYSDSEDLRPYATFTITDIRGLDATIEFSSEVDGVGSITDDIGLGVKADQNAFGREVAALMDDADSRHKQDWPKHVRAACRLVRKALRDEASDAGVDAPLVLIDARHAAPSPDADRWLVDQLMRRGQVIVIASTEGLGKSQLARELGLRLALAEGSLLGRYSMPAPESVLVVDMENGPDEELRREDDVLAAIGKKRADLPEGRYHRVSYPNIMLTGSASSTSRQRLVSAIRQSKAALTVLDTGGMLVGTEWGDEFKEFFNWLKGVAVAESTTILVAVHVTKGGDEHGGRGRQKAQPQGIQKVMGQWTRWADGVLQMTEAGDDDTMRLDIRKRIPNASYICKRDEGLWRVVSAIKEVPKVVQQTLRFDIIDTIARSEPVLKAEVVARLASDEKGRSRSTLFNKVGQEVTGLTDALVEEDDHHRLALTKAGRAWLEDAKTPNEEEVELEGRAGEPGVSASGGGQMEMGVGQGVDGPAGSKSQSSPSPEQASARRPEVIQSSKCGVQPQSSSPSVESNSSPETLEAQSNESNAPIYRGRGLGLDSTGSRGSDRSVGEPDLEGSPPSPPDSLNGHKPPCMADSDLFREHASARHQDGQVVTCDLCPSPSDDEVTVEQVWQEMGA